MFNSSEISKSSKATEIDFINKENEKPVLPIKDHNSQNFTNSKDFININDDTNKHSVSNTTDSLKESNGLDFKNVNITNENIIEEVLVIKENITNAIKPTILLDNDDNKKIKNQMLDSNVENIFPLKGEINSKEIVLQTFDFDKENVMTKSFDKNLSTTTIIPIDISINISTNDIKTGETIKIVLEDDTTTIKTTSTTTEKEMTEKNILVTTETNKDNVTKSPKSTFIVVKVVNNKIVEERIFETEDEVKRIVFTTTTTTTTTTLAPTTTKEAKITTQVIPPAPITKKQNKASSLKQPSPPSSRPPSDEIIKKLNAAVDFIAMAKDLGIFHETQN
uniref:UBA domain-containing protein n=1 Tax=Parastrongyloides trichosuri TaxID=131310 RepID=A0A0N4ZEW9_PARTI